MLWVKAFHIIFVVTWFAGLFYLPRLFVYHSMTNDSKSHEQFRVMERRLLGITNIGGSLALLFGLWLGVLLVALVPGYLVQPWFIAKLVLVVLLIIYHLWCASLVRQFANGDPGHNHVWYRWFNEIPTLILIAVVMLVVVKPF